MIVKMGRLVSLCRRGCVCVFVYVYVRVGVYHTMCIIVFLLVCVLHSIIYHIEPLYVLHFDRTKYCI